ncbi:predicted protein [Naegleria gruberi]|uniref:Predicted protein n=1 Tax=Naegleria gruberi TaxID=5762 RepID=D2VYC3_NAEGR|nr:uncharacterized protein NAEGRDRAFT_81703 [Naegleria gruberi]EFC38180.1 predicted protein [Naegleria gruberi]|eukprot:XP_002670924.1 predicted protein [Naegleria gruberi strain NEG-M]
MSTRLVDYIAVVGSPYDPREMMHTKRLSSTITKYTSTVGRDQTIDSEEDEEQRSNLSEVESETLSVGENSSNIIDDKVSVGVVVEEVGMNSYDAVFDNSAEMFMDKLRKPIVLDRYPREDYPSAPLSPEIPLFCFPNGEIGIRIDECTLPMYYTFVLTAADGNKTYGACLNIWEEYHLEDELLNTEKKDNDDGMISITFDPIKTERETSTIYMSKSIVLISHYPFYNLFKFFLTQMYRISITPSKIPIERFISNFIFEVPLPCQGKVQVHYSIGDKEIFITRPPPNELPMAEVDFELLFCTLSIENIMILFDLVLQEKKILFTSSHVALLTQISEIICHLVFPFKWHHIYIPLLPAKCAEFLFAPVPFMMGLAKDFVNNIEIPSDVFQIDLDNNQIVCSKQQSIPNLPEKQKIRLQNTLNSLVRTKVGSQRAIDKLHFVDLAYAMAPITEEIDPKTGEAFPFPTREVRMAFTRFFVSLFFKYKNFFREAQDSELESMLDLDHFFNKNAFTHQLPEQARSFMEIFLHTQTFERFLLDRLEKVNQNEVQYFEELMIQKDNESKFKFRKQPTPFLSKNFAISRTLMALSPDNSNLTSSTEPYIYLYFPTKLDHTLFTKREYTQLLVSESDVVSNNEINLSWKSCIAALSSLSTNQYSNKTDNNTKMASANIILDENRNENLFDRFSFQTDSKCYHCEHICKESEIRSGWSSSNSQSYTTTCTHCSKQFVPYFSVYFKLPSVTQELHQLTSVEYLSPLVIRKEIENLISHDVKADSALCWQHPVLFWNLVVHFRSLPLSFIFPCIDWNAIQSHLVTSLSQNSTVN